MHDRLTRVLKVVAIAVAVAFVGWAVCEKFVVGSAPGDFAYHDANKLFEDGYHERTAAGYREALAEAPDHLHALRGLARSLHSSGRTSNRDLRLDDKQSPYCTAMTCGDHRA